MTKIYSLTLAKLWYQRSSMELSVVMLLAYAHLLQLLDFVFRESGAKSVRASTASGGLPEVMRTANSGLIPCRRRHCGNQRSRCATNSNQETGRLTPERGCLEPPVQRKGDEYFKLGWTASASACRCLPGLETVACHINHKMDYFSTGC